MIAQEFLNFSADRCKTNGFLRVHTSADDRLSGDDPRCLCVQDTRLQATGRFRQSKVCHGHFTVKFDFSVMYANHT